MKHRKEFLLGLFILSAAALLAYMSLTIGKVQFGDSLEISARFDNAIGVVKDAPVMMAGIEIGHVESLDVENGRAHLKLTIHPDVTIHSDAHAGIRSKSLLGEKYIAIDKGSESLPQLQDGDEIMDTHTPVDLDEVLNHLAPVLTKLDPEDLNTLVHTVAVGLRGRGEELGKIISGTSVLMETFSNKKDSVVRIVDNLDGFSGRANQLLATNGPAIDRLVRNLDATAITLKTDVPELTRNLNNVTQDVQQITGPFKGNANKLASDIDRIADNAARFTTVLNNHPNLVPNLNNSLKELPPLLQKAPATLDRLPAVLDQLTPVLKGADSTLKQLDPVLKKADHLLEENSIKELLQEEGIKVHVDRGIQVRLW